MKHSSSMSLLIVALTANVTLAQQTISSAGGNGSSPTGSISYTAGQVSYKATANPAGRINEGVQQPLQVTTPVLPTELVVSNYISPNNDGENDTWKMIPLEKVANYKVVVTNQWGTTVFEKDSNYQNEWDATLNGKKLPDGVYYYSLLENDQVVGKGSITVLSN
jgi:gliding motility-associated-like protein